MFSTTAAGDSTRANGDGAAFFHSRVGQVEVGADDTEVGRVLRIRSRVLNQGNVAIVPELQLEVSGLDRVIGSHVYRETQVAPGQDLVISSIWETGTLAPGTYRLKMTAQTQGLALGSVTRDFHIVARGALTRDGRLDKLVVVGQPAKGALVQVDGTFTNGGAIETTARLSIKVFKGTQLVDARDSQPKLVFARNSDTLSAFTQVKNPGAYRVVGLVNFDGIETKAGETTFSVTGSDAGTKFPLVPVAASGAVLALFGGGTYEFRRRRRWRRYL